MPIDRARPDVIDAFRGLSALVIGEAMLDVYLRGTTDRLCREAPVPIVAVAERRDVPGGAANVAVNLGTLGAQVTFLSVTGDDAEGTIVRRLLAERGIDTEHVLADPARRTLTKRRVFAGAQLLVRFDEGTTERIDECRERRIAAALESLFLRHDVIVVSDYGYGILTPAVIRVLRRLQARSPRVVVVDSKTLGAYQPVGVTAVKPNYDEAVRLLGIRSAPRGPARIDLIAERGGRLLELTSAQIAAVTLDTEGAIFFERGRTPYRTYARPVEHSRAAGAGDTFAAALALGLASGAHLPAVAEIASAASAVVVSKDGTAMCTAGELVARLCGSEKHCPDRVSLLARLDRHRRERRRVVLTNGCFDILHRGHITYLNAAKALGDVLIVGVNSDASVSRLKGPQRPINPLEDRLHVLAALSSVDHVVSFDEDTPVELVRVVRPDVFVKGGDYQPDMLPEAPVVEALGGVVRILPYVEDRSTTSIIERARAGEPELGSAA
jgi:D-beta-D-heptose 7-phosphate kinase/D-beta-D-heptose 1-phosphate adenosyltransferase